MAKWDGPYYIQQRLSNDVYLVDQGRSLVKVHASQIKPAYQDEANTPQTRDNQLNITTTSSATAQQTSGNQEVAVPHSNFAVVPINQSADYRTHRQRDCPIFVNGGGKKLQCKAVTKVTLCIFAMFKASYPLALPAVLAIIMRLFLYMRLASIFYYIAFNIYFCVLFYICVSGNCVYHCGITMLYSEIYITLATQRTLHT